MHVAVKDFSAARAHVHNQALLMLRAGIIFAVTEDLQVGETTAYGPGP
ncbi:MAG TPA: hypothetical protein VHS08_05220 [Candidatus Acidoferrales bacterium]|jgi:hypothetical protein|nr:hypothetical protein [Candidatus Acidoferrales bacterium]